MLCGVYWCRVRCPGYWKCLDTRLLTGQPRGDSLRLPLASNVKHQMRQLSVQQQNSTTEEGIRRSALYWRSLQLPKALVEVATVRGVDCESAMMLNLEVDFPGMPRLFGTLVTVEGRFFYFEIETDKSHSQVEGVEVWRDSTDEQDFGLHNPGTGVGAGALALKVLREVNADA